MQTALNTHTGNKSNPHSVTKSQVGLGNVPNVATNDQTPTYSDTTTLVTLSSGEKISIAFAKIKLAITTLINHLANKSNPHGVTKSQVGLGNVENKSSATIRGELTKGNVTTALGYTPANQADMTNAQDAITQLNSDYDTIIVGTSVSTVSQTISHYGGRKLSDYKFIVFAFGASDDDIRSIVTVPRIIFEKIGKSYSFVAHGSNDSTISVASFTYASDTATTIKLSADHGVKYIRVFGIK